MGYDLNNAKNNYFRFSHWNWRRYLKLASDYGWQPAGTIMSGDSAWDGNYLSNSRQRITAEDAGGLADAWQRALDDQARGGSARPNATGEGDPSEGHVVYVISDSPSVSGGDLLAAGALLILDDQAWRKMGPPPVSPEMIAFFRDGPIWIG